MENVHQIFTISLSEVSKINTVKEFLLENNIPFAIEDDSNKETEVIDVKKLGRKGLIILELLSKGFTYEQIAKKVNITIDGVRFYIKKIYKVLNVSNSSLAVRYYIEHLESKKNSEF